MKKLLLVIIMIYCVKILDAATINIPADYSKIQAGIDNAITGDVVLVEPGNYTENINFNGKNITVTSLYYTTSDTSYISQTIIDGNNNGSVVKFENNEDSTAILSGFTITNGSSFFGGGIFCGNSSPCLDNLMIKDNSSVYGGGIYCDNSSPSIENSKISENNAQEGGGGISCDNSYMTITNVTISANNGDWGGGIFCGNSSPYFENVKIADNFGLGGGGIFCGNSNIIFTDVTVSGNSSSSGDGVITCDNTSLRLENANILDNFTYAGGGSICCTESDLELENVTIKGNYSSMQGAMYCTSSDLSIINSSIKGNICSGIYYDDIGNHIFDLKNVTITGNSGVGIMCWTSSPNLENVTISGNNGGGIYCRDNSNPSLVNCILWNDAQQEILFVDGGYPNTITISYSDILGGEAGIVTNSNGTVNWLDGNIDDDPLFVDPIDPTQAPTDEGNCHLTENSPCIDTGDPNSPLDPDSTRADMGAYYFNHYTALSLPTDVTGTAFSNVLIPLDYSNIDSEGIEGIEATISFDETLLQGIGATLTETVLENEDYGIEFNNVSDSLISVWIYANSDLFEGGGTVVYLEFMVDQNAIPGDYTELIFEQAEVNEIPVYTSNGLFTVEVDFKISLPTDAMAAPGEQINIPLYVDNYFNLGIEVIETVVRYDSTMLEATGATLADGVLEDQNYSIQTSTGSDSINILIYATSSLYTSGGIVAYIEFDIDETASIGDTTELEFIFAEINETPIGTDDGLFTVFESYSISGHTNYYHDQANISNAIIQLEESKYEALSDTNGYYKILNILTGDYISSASKYDELGGLSSLDASRIARYGVGLYSLTDYEIIAADVSLNASVSPLDASRVARYGVGLIDELNDDNINWVFAADSVDSTTWPPIYYETLKYYTPLSANMTDQDFVGVRLGDVTGNWSPSKKKLIAGTNDISAILPEVTGAPTDTVTVPLDVFGLENLEGMDITITFNEQVVDALDATINGGILENENFGYQVNTNNDNEIVLWIYALGDPYSGSGTVAYIDFEVVGAVDDSTDIAFAQFDVNEVDYLCNTVDGSLLVVPYSINGNDIPKEIFLGQNYPNPVKSNTEIYFGLTKKTEVDISIYNLKGQLVEKVIQASFDPGYHSVRYSVENLNNGIYFYKMSVDGVDKEVKKIILLR